MKNQKKSHNNFTIEQVREKIDEYKGTIHAIQAFISLTTWDNQTRQIKSKINFSFGRRMSTSPKNKILPNSQITPDVVIQLAKNLGYSVEAKYSMPKDPSHWEDDIKQLLKYDDTLQGWWTKDEYIPDHCTVMLIEQGRVVKFVEHLKKWINKNKLSFGKTTSIVRFSKSDNAKPYYYLQSDWGNILDKDLSNRLKYGEKIPIEKVVATYGTKKFYDTEPPAVEFTMSIIWQDILTQEAPNSKYDKKFGGIPLYVNLDNLTSEIQKLYGQESNSARDVEFPRKDWIQSAMEEFINIGLARRLYNNPNGYDYLVIFKQIKKELLEFFVDNRKKASSKGKQAKQLDLFDTH